MAFSYDVSTDVGRVRLLITDRDFENPIFQDDEIETFLALEDDSIRLAAALALETIAADQVLVLKVIKTLDLTTDGAKVSDALCRLADKLREAEEREGAFAIAEQVNNDFGYRERIWKQFQRGLL